mgnify:CR=1 FL=1
MTFVVIIPARYASSRLPGKPLADIGGKPMIQRVYELAKKSKAAEVYIATDHNDIIDCCSSFGANALMTNSQHPSGTDRIAEISELLNLSPDTVVINVQGDEPFLNFSDIDNLADFFIEERRFDLCTLYSDFTPQQVMSDPNLVKLWIDKNNVVKGFSRKEDFIKKKKFLRALHIGVYIYKVDFIKQFVTWKQSRNEKKENLEQLRALEKGRKIGAIKSLSKEHIGIDTQEDLNMARDLI